MNISFSQFLANCYNCRPLNLGDLHSAGSDIARPHVLGRQKLNTITLGVTDVCE